MRRGSANTAVVYRTVMLAMLQARPLPATREFVPSYIPHLSRQEKVIGLHQKRFRLGCSFRNSLSKPFLDQSVIHSSRMRYISKFSWRDDIQSSTNKTRPTSKFRIARFISKPSKGRRHYLKPFLIRLSFKFSLTKSAASILWIKSFPRISMAQCVLECMFTLL